MDSKIKSLIFTLSIVFASIEAHSLGGYSVSNYKFRYWYPANLVSI